MTFVALLGLEIQELKATSWSDPLFLIFFLLVFALICLLFDVDHVSLPFPLSPKVKFNTCL